MSVESTNAATDQKNGVIIQDQFSLHNTHHLFIIVTDI